MEIANIHTPNPLADYRFYAPLPDGRALVSCHAQNAVLVVDKEGNVQGRLETTPTFAKPEGIALNSKGQVFVVDRFNHCIHIFNPDLTHHSSIVPRCSDLKSLNQPVGIAISALDDRIWVADNENHRVVVLSAEGKYISTLGNGYGTAPGQLFCPCGVALFDHPVHGELVIVSEWGGGRVQVFRSTGEVFNIYSGVQHAHHVVVDAKGTVIVTEYATRRLKRFNLDGDQGGVQDASVVSLVERKHDGLSFLIEQHRVVRLWGGGYLKKRKAACLDDQD